MNLKSLVAATVLLIGCAASKPTPVTAHQEPLTFAKIQPVFVAACIKSVGEEQQDFCTCTWEQATELYSADEMAHGMRNGPKLKMELWKLAIVGLCVPQLK